MSFLKVQHTDGSTVLLDTSEGVYYRLSDVVAHNLAPDDSIIMNGRYFAYFSTVQVFLDSKKVKAIVPVYCMKKETKGKRFKIQILSGKKTGEFFNVERIGGGWVNNEIDNILPNKAFFLYLEKNKDADNECLIKGVKEIKKPGTK
jgi:hypothetical protein